MGAEVVSRRAIVAERVGAVGRCLYLGDGGDYSEERGGPMLREDYAGAFEMVRTAVVRLGQPFEWIPGGESNVLVRPLPGEKLVKSHRHDHFTVSFNRLPESRLVGMCLELTLQAIGRQNARDAVEINRALVAYGWNGSLMEKADLRANGQRRAKVRLFHPAGPRLTGVDISTWVGLLLPPFTWACLLELNRLGRACLDVVA